jgi:hydroxymethylpyrimidine pyrophosphatase-like HAD family hydrolase
MLNVQKETAVAVGDSSNDLPLFRGVGYKVAMGNATEELKEEADYITASVEEDGLAQFIEQRILSQT